MMINVKNNYFTLTVKKDIILDNMNDTTTYLNVETINMLQLNLVRKAN